MVAICFSLKFGDANFILSKKSSAVHRESLLHDLVLLKCASSSTQQVSWKKPTAFLRERNCRFYPGFALAGGIVAAGNQEAAEDNAFQSRNVEMAAVQM